MADFKEMTNFSSWTSTHIAAAIVIVLLVIYFIFPKAKEMFTSSAGTIPSVILFTRGPAECASCTRGDPNACVTCQFNRLAKWYGRINVYHVPNVELNSDIPVNMITKFPTVAFMPEGLSNYNLVRVYRGPMKAMDIEHWIKSLPGSSL